MCPIIMHSSFIYLIAEQMRDVRIIVNGQKFTEIMNLSYTSEPSRIIKAWNKLVFYVFLS